MDPTVHTFDSTSEAYDDSQVNDAVKVSDVLAVPREGVVGALVEAWPEPGTCETCNGHGVGEGSTNMGGGLTA